MQCRALDLSNLQLVRRAQWERDNGDAALLTDATVQRTMSQRALQSTGRQAWDLLEAPWLSCVHAVAGMSVSHPFLIL
jgi:hypothetical protein